MLSELWALLSFLSENFWKIVGDIMPYRTNILKYIPIYYKNNEHTTVHDGQGIKAQHFEKQYAQFVCRNSIFNVSTENF